MTQRERIMAGAVLGVLGVYGAFRGIKAGYIEPRKDLVNQRVAEMQRAESLDLELARAERVKEKWQAETARTLDVSAFEAHKKFRSDLSTLVSNHGLTDVSIRTGTRPPPIAKGHRKGWIEAPVIINAEGTLANVVELMHDLYERPYLLRVKGFDLNAENALARRAVSSKREGKDKNGKRAPGASAEPDELRLRVRLDVSTLILPAIAGAPHRPLDLAAAPPPDDAVLAGGRPMLRRESPEDYREIVTRDIFRIYEPPPAVVVAPPEPVEASPRPTPPPPRPAPPPPPDPRRDAGKLRLVGTTSLNGELIAYVENSDDLSEPLIEHRLNDPVDDGRLVLVHPRGIVVRSPQPDGGHTNWVYFNNDRFDQREELDPSRGPEYQELDRLVTYVLNSSVAAHPAID